MDLMVARFIFIVQLNCLIIPLKFLFQTALDFYYSPAERLVEAGKKIRMFLREEVGLPAEPSEVAKLAEIIFDD